MTHYKFKILFRLVAILMAAVVIAAIGGFASQRWFEVAAGVYIVVGIGIMLLPRRK